MKKKYTIPTTKTIALHTISILAASQPLKHTDKEASKDYEVLSNKFDSKQFDWE